MIEKQSDNVENAEENVSGEGNVNEESSVIEDQTKDDNQITDAINEKINVMFKKFSQLYEIDLQDMLSYVLNDSGEKYFFSYNDTSICFSL